MNCYEWVFLLLAYQKISHPISTNTNFNCCAVVTLLLPGNGIAVSASRQPSLQGYIQRPWENSEMQSGLFGLTIALQLTLETF